MRAALWSVLAVTASLTTGHRLGIELSKQHLHPAIVNVTALVTPPTARVQANSTNASARIVSAPAPVAPVNASAVAPVKASATKATNATANATAAYARLTPLLRPMRQLAVRALMYLGQQPVSGQQPDPVEYVGTACVVALGIGGMAWCASPRPAPCAPLDGDHAQRLR